MSEQISTLDDKVCIRSFVDREGFGLSIMHKDRGKIGYEEFSWEDYEVLLRGLWDGYLTSGQKPRVAGQTLSDNGLVTETLHFIAPGSFSDPLGSTLRPNQESFIYWLKLQYSRILTTIDKEAFQYLDRELDSILRINLERKNR